MFELLYTQHGGSGMNLNLEDVMSLPLGRLEWFVTQLQERRQKEADAIKAAAPKPRRRK